jgi:hypothetical protein
MRVADYCCTPKTILPRQGLAFMLEQCLVEGDIVASRILWDTDDHSDFEPGPKPSRSIFTPRASRADRITLGVRPWSRAIRFTSAGRRPPFCSPCWPAGRSERLCRAAFCSTRFGGERLIGRDRHRPTETRDRAAISVTPCYAGERPGLLSLAKRGPSTTLRTNFKCSAVAAPFRRCISSMIRARQRAWQA